ncbi:MAG: hypothetical protein RLZZ15_3483 [Verrucomicrobiota bacterium]|jgi:hypothetical protein
MNGIRLNFLLFALGASLNFARATPRETAIELVGVLSTGGSMHLALRDTLGGPVEWVLIGREFRGYQIKSYSSNDETALVERNQRQFTLHLAPAHTTPAPQRGPLTADESKRIFSHLRQISTASTSYFLAFGYPPARFEDLTGDTERFGFRLILTSVAGEDYHTVPFFGREPLYSITINGETITYDERVGVENRSTHYVFKFGDNATKVARSFGLSVSKLVELNPHFDPAKPRIDDTIRIR